ncbi:MAG: 6-phosphogluconolactonase [Phycisphaerales bacterium]
MTTTPSAAREIVRCVDPDAVACAAVERIVAAASAAIAARGRFTIALAGGSTPEATYRRLADPRHSARIDWTRTLVFMGDERVVPFDDPRSNFGMASRTLLAHVPIPRQNVFPVDLPGHGGDDDARRAAAGYAAILAKTLHASPDGPPPALDLIMLGLGDDGHTASLFPGAASLAERRLWVTWSHAGTLPPPVDRVTFTYPTLDAAREVMFLVAGEKKSSVVAEVLGGRADPGARPSAAVRPTHGALAWILDEGAARGLGPPRGPIGAPGDAVVDAASERGAGPPLRLCVSDVDGTLVTSAKVIAESTLDTVAALRDAGIAFSIVSSRPPRGLHALVEALRPTAPLAAFNGAALVAPDLRVIERHTIDPAVVRRVVAIIREHSLDVWIHAGDDWLVRDRHGVHVDREVRAVQYEPTVVADVASRVDDVAKIVGVSENHDDVKAAEAAILAELGDRVSASRSQAHFVDVTAPGIDKGVAVRRIAERQGAGLQATAVVGDGANDTPMFAVARLGIAMGNAVADVQRRAACVTASNDEDGFARAVRAFVLPEARFR